MKSNILSINHVKFVKHGKRKYAKNGHLDIFSVSIAHGGIVKLLFSTLFHLRSLRRDNGEISVQQSTDLFGETVTLKFEATDGNRGNTAVLVTYVGNNNLKIKINYGGQNMDYIISETEYSLDLK